MNRSDGRRPGVLRPVKITRNYMKHAEGSALIEFGEAKLICTASVENRCLPFLGKAGQRLGDGGVRHAAALDAYAILAGIVNTPVARGAQKRSSVLSGARCGPRWRPSTWVSSDRSIVPGLRRDPGRRRHAHGGHHRRLGGAGSVAVRRLVARKSCTRIPMSAAVCARCPPVWSRARRGSIWLTQRIPPPTWISTSCSPTTCITSSIFRARPRASRFLAGRSVPAALC